MGENDRYGFGISSYDGEARCSRATMISGEAAIRLPASVSSFPSSPPCGSDIESNVLTFDPAQLPQPRAKRGVNGRYFLVVKSGDDTDQPFFVVLLRDGRGRPHRRASDQCDELASSHRRLRSRHLSLRLVP